MLGGGRLHLRRGQSGSRPHRPRPHGRALLVRTRRDPRPEKHVPLAADVVLPQSRDVPHGGIARPSLHLPSVPPSSISVALWTGAGLVTRVRRRGTDRLDLRCSSFERRSSLRGHRDSRTAALELRFNHRTPLFHRVRDRCSGHCCARDVWSFRIGRGYPMAAPRTSRGRMDIRSCQRRRALRSLCRCSVRRPVWRRAPSPRDEGTHLRSVRENGIHAADRRVCACHSRDPRRLGSWEALDQETCTDLPRLDDAHGRSLCCHPRLGLEKTDVVRTGFRIHAHPLCGDRCHCAGVVRNYRRALGGACRRSRPGCPNAGDRTRIS